MLYDFKDRRRVQQLTLDAVLAEARSKVLPSPTFEEAYR